jgi:hypothetical protein
MSDFFDHSERRKRSEIPIGSMILLAMAPGTWCLQSRRLFSRRVNGPAAHYRYPSNGLAQIRDNIEAPLLEATSITQCKFPLYLQAIFAAQLEPIETIDLPNRGHRLRREALASRANKFAC